MEIVLGLKSGEMGGYKWLATNQNKPLMTISMKFGGACTAQKYQALGTLSGTAETTERKHGIKTYYSI